VDNDQTYKKQMDDDPSAFFVSIKIVVVFFLFSSESYVRIASFLGSTGS